MSLIVDIRQSFRRITVSVGEAKFTGSREEIARLSEVLAHEAQSMVHESKATYVIDIRPVEKQAPVIAVGQP